MGFYETELAIFDEKRPTWLPDHEGQWVVINNVEILGPFREKADAYQAAFAKYGETPFLLQQILAEDEVVMVPLFRVHEEHD